MKNKEIFPIFVFVCLRKFLFVSCENDVKIQRIFECLFFLVKFDKKKDKSYRADFLNSNIKKVKLPYQKTSKKYNGFRRKTLKNSRKNQR